MFGLKKKGPSRPTQAFAHAVGCTIVTADPGFQPEWQEIEEGHWRRICQCWSEDITSHASTRELDSTRWIRPPSATGRHASTGRQLIPPSSGPSCGS